MKQVKRRPLDQIDEWFDSDIIAGKNYFYKQYFAHITKEVLSDYHTIHQYLSHFEREIKLPMAQMYNDTLIKKVIFDVVPLNDSHVTTVYNLETKKEILVSVPPHVKWENLNSYRVNAPIWDTDICHSIRYNIVQALSIYFPYIDISSLSFQNIMITKAENDIIYCTITDLGDNIVPFVDDQKEMWIFEKIVAGKIKKRKSDKVIVRYKDSGKLV